MSQSYQKSCRDCKQQITMKEMNGKWGAYNLDGSYHQCLSTSKQLSLEGLDTRLKRVENMLFNGTEAK